MWIQAEQKIEMNYNRNFRQALLEEGDDPDMCRYQLFNE